MSDRLSADAMSDELEHEDDDSDYSHWMLEEPAELWPSIAPLSLLPMLDAQFNDCIEGHTAF